jgi:hypothetical protein
MRQQVRGWNEHHRGAKPDWEAVFAVRKLEREAQPSKRTQGSAVGHGGIETVPLQSLLCAVLFHELVYEPVHELAY